ncbi:MAG: hypothetical protein DRO01_07160 [Thermoproteota archaeon]|nr:MAG: hypothetical protein DRO01_07160 [Candidatus Korarchaeota archaeon]
MSFEGYQILYESGCYFLLHSKTADNFLDASRMYRSTLLSGPSVWWRRRRMEICKCKNRRWVAREYVEYSWGKGYTTFLFGKCVKCRGYTGFPEENFKIALEHGFNPGKADVEESKD